MTRVDPPKPQPNQTIRQWVNETRIELGYPPFKDDEYPTLEWQESLRRDVENKARALGLREP